MGRRPLCRTAIGFAPRVGHLQAEPGIAPVSEIPQLLRYGDSHWTRTAPSPPLLPGSPEPPHPPPAPPSPYMKPMPPVPPLQPPPAPCPVRPLTPMNPDGPLETPPKPPTPPNRPPVAPLAVNVVPPQATDEAVPLAPFVRVVVKPPKTPAPTVTAHTSPAETVTKPWQTRRRRRLRRSGPRSYLHCRLQRRLRPRHTAKRSAVRHRSGQ